jgi:proline iminopeptidase
MSRTLPRVFRMPLAKPALLTALAMLAVAVVATPAAHATPAAPSGPGARVDANGTTIWYEVRGSAGGRPLVMVNGGPGFDHTYVLCSDAWDKLAQGRRVVFYDQRGTGRSAALKKGQSCTLADQVADLEALRVRLGAAQIDLLGHSWGGYLVMAYSVRHPDRVAHLIIADSAAPKWTDTDFIFKYIFPETVDAQAQLDFAEALGDTGAAAVSMHKYLGMLFVSSDKREDFLSRAKSYKYTRAVNEALNADLGKLDMTPELRTLRMPTLVITGRYDINVAPSTAWRIHNAIAGSGWQVFEQSGHLPYFEEPEKFVRVVDDFLGTP